MRKKLSALLLVMLALCAVVVACGEEETHEKEPDSNQIRIYDVEPQVSDENMNVQHYLRVGVLTDFEDYTNEKAPFANQIEKIAEETGAEIEYVVFDNWEELHQAELEFEDANVTEMILFNNTYDESLIKEASSGRYADMEGALKEYGFYEEEAYNQTVLEAGQIGNQHVLVPILYNVSGMIHGDGEYYPYEEWRKMAYDHAENSHIDYESFIEMLKEAMILANVEKMELPFMSTGFLEGKVDLYLTAAGIKWDAYEKQYELFELLHHYLSTYQETQVDVKEDGVSNQALYGKYLESFKYMPFMEKLGDREEVSYLPSNIADELQIENEWAAEGEQLLLSWIVIEMLNNTEYLVESTGREEIAFHSVYGLLAYRDYYGAAFSNGKVGKDFEITQIQNMQYWPIGIMGSEKEYAAQPICYAAVVEGGSTRLAAKVLQSMMNQPVDAKYGISLCNASRDLQLEVWAKENDQAGNVRKIHVTEDGPVKEIKNPAYWCSVIGSVASYSLEDKEIYATQIQTQLDNISVAQIPDREILSIWQDTLTEAVESGLSAEAGFELLCERMDAWYEE